MATTGVNMRNNPTFANNDSKLGKLITLLYNQKLSSDNKKQQVNTLLNNQGLISEINSMTVNKKKAVHEKVYKKLENGFNKQHEKLEKYLGIVKASNNLKKNNKEGNKTNTATAAANAAAVTPPVTGGGGTNAAAAKADAVTPSLANNPPVTGAGNNPGNNVTLNTLNVNLRDYKANNKSPNSFNKLKKNLAKYLTNSNKFNGNVNKNKINDTKFSALISSNNFNFSEQNLSKINIMVGATNNNITFSTLRENLKAWQNNKVDVKLNKLVSNAGKYYNIKVNNKKIININNKGLGFILLNKSNASSKDLNNFKQSIANDSGANQ
jgi:hypothetical protein